MHGPNLALIIAKDIEASAEFYERIFDWTAAPYRPYGGYTYATDTIDVILVPAGAFSGAKASDEPVWGTSLAFQHPHLEAMWEHVLSEGAEIVIPMYESGYGEVFVFADPSGNRITVYS